MSQIIPIYIPTFISDATYAPARVLPHIYFFNGLVDCETYWVADVNLNAVSRNQFPYFDNYSVVSGSFPTSGSKSLLFTNENPVYGNAPTASLYTEYWNTYISLLYNPKTRLLTAEAIIPLADYVKMELNDVVNFRGNYYHLRAINDYSLKTGECTLQLLGPIIADTISDLQPIPPPPPTPYATASIYLSEFTSGGVFLDANLIVSGTAYYSSGHYSQSISGGTVALATLQAAESTIYNVWNGYSTGSATLIVRDNGTLITSSTALYYSGSGDKYWSASVTFTAGHNIEITGSTTLTGSQSPVCCAPTITTASVSGGNLNISFTTGSGATCQTCLATRTQLSTNNSTWNTPISTSCSSPNVITLPTSSVYIRMWQICTTNETSSLSNTYYFNSGSAGSATLDWSFSRTGGATGTMDIFVNSSNVISRNATSSGTYTVYQGDQIYVDISVSNCSGGNDKANAYTLGIIAEAACSSSLVSLTTSTYTVQPGDVGTTISLDSFAHCDSGCI